MRTCGPALVATLSLLGCTARDGFVEAGTGDCAGQQCAGVPDALPPPILDPSFPVANSFSSSPGFSTDPFSTGGPDRLVIVQVTFCYPFAGAPTAVTCAGSPLALAWRQSNLELCGIDFWARYFSTQLVDATCAVALSGPTDATDMVFSFTGSDPILGVATGVSRVAPARLVIEPLGPSSYLLAGGIGWNAAAITPLANNTLLLSADNVGDTAWAQRYDYPAAGGLFTLGTSAPLWNEDYFAAVEVRAAP